VDSDVGHDSTTNVDTPCSEADTTLGNKKGSLLNHGRQREKEVDSNGSKSSHWILRDGCNKNIAGRFLVGCDRKC
jgi:hypothetical protein